MGGVDGSTIGITEVGSGRREIVAEGRLIDLQTSKCTELAHPVSSLSR